MGLFSAESNPLAVLDLGSHQTRVLIAGSPEEGELEMLGYGQRMSVGVAEGMINNPKWAEQSIADAVASAENLAGLTVQRMAVGLNTKMVRSLTITLEQSLHGRAVSPSLRAELTETAKDHAVSRLPSSLQWGHLHVIPIGYSLDGSELTDFPDGLFGETLVASYHLISVPMMAVQNIRECLARNGIEAEKFILSPYAAGLAALDPAAQEYGATLVDLGGDTTSVATFGKWKLLQTATIPVGGNDITRDIAQHFGFNPDRAEKLKVTQGNLAATFNSPSIDEAATLFDARGFEHAELNPIVEARMHETLLAVQSILESPSFIKHQTHSLFLTGAGAHLKGLHAYAEALFNDKRIKLASPKRISGAPEGLAHAGFATAIGLLKYTAKWRSQASTRGKSLPQNGNLTSSLPLVRRLFGS
ncbi:MAG: cell division protein FtsA [Alphaproteobacteria bacterium]